MQSIQQLTESDLPTDTHAPTSAITQTPSLRTLDEFWRRMLGMYGNTWASQYGDHPSGTTAATWAETLVGIDPAAIAVGLRACLAEGREFPPSAPRFRAMCLGIPAFSAVKFESTKPDAERSPFTRAVWMHLDGYAYRQASARDGDRLLRDAYELASEAVMRGAQLPKPAAAALADASKEKPSVNPDPEARAAIVAKAKAETFGEGEFERLTWKPAEPHEPGDVIRNAQGETCVITGPYPTEAAAHEPTKTDEQIALMRGLYGSSPINQRDEE